MSASAFKIASRETFRLWCAPVEVVCENLEVGTSRHFRFAREIPGATDSQEYVSEYARGGKERQPFLPIAHHVEYSSRKCACRNAAKREPPTAFKPAGKVEQQTERPAPGQENSNKPERRLPDHVENADSTCNQPDREQQKSGKNRQCHTHNKIHCPQSPTVYLGVGS